MVVLAAGFWFEVSPTEWVALVTAIGLVFVTEMINTAVERTVDLVTSEKHPLARQAKDLAAGAVLIAAITSVVIAVFIFGPKILPPKPSFTNSLGMELIRIPSGEFRMGQNQAGDWDEAPEHQVKISRDFFMAATEVTNAQYEEFRPEHNTYRGKLGISSGDDEAVVQVSYEDAQAFCKWLSEKEGRLYRLPTEAEWEYACRAGTTTPFYTGYDLPASFHKNQQEVWTYSKVDLRVKKTLPNAFGLFDMHGNVEEWCSDWYGSYPDDPEKNPAGPDAGIFRVSRGGSHHTPITYLRSANRSGTLPGDRSAVIGFRVVCGKETRNFRPADQADADWSREVNQQPDTSETVTKPVFLEPLPYVNIPKGSDGPLYDRHNHCPALTTCPNGDLLAIWYTCQTESGRELAIAASRFRAGADRWGEPALFFDAPDRNDHASDLILDPESGTIHFFNGLSSEATWGKLALIHRQSLDNGATWSEPVILNPEHGLMNQPIAGGFIDSRGRIILKSDAVTTSHGGTVVHTGNIDLSDWQSPDPDAVRPDFRMGEQGNRIAGIHAGIVELNDGTWLALGRGDTLGGRMPQSISDDFGQTWQWSASVFPSIGGGQRLVLMRLHEGPILLLSFCNEPWELLTDIGENGEKVYLTGLFAALSYDEGKSWPVKKLITEKGKSRELNGGAWTQTFVLDDVHAEPKGYLAAAQAKDGVIHLISSGIHYRFNLAWIEQH